MEDFNEWLARNYEQLALKTGVISWSREYVVGPSRAGGAWQAWTVNTWVSPAVALVLIGTKMFRWFICSQFLERKWFWKFLFLPNRGLWIVALFLVAKAAVDPDQSTKELRFCFPIDIFDQVVWKEISSYPSFYHIAQLDHVLCFQELEVWRFHPWEEVQGASVSTK